MFSWGYGVDDGEYVEWPRKCKIDGAFELLKTPDFGLALADSWDSDEVPVFVGGDHAISAHILDGYQRIGVPVPGLLVFDAHLDLWPMEKHDNTSFLWNYIMAGAKVSVVGVIDLQHYYEAIDNGVTVVTNREIEASGIGYGMARALQGLLGASFIHLSVDADVLEPDGQGSVTSPLVGGMTARELDTSFDILAGSPFSSMDCSEMLSDKSPRHDWLETSMCNLATTSSYYYGQGQP